MDNRRIAVRAIAFKDGKLLANKFLQEDGSESSFWGTPGGGLNPHESLIDGLRREMIEETGIIPKIGRLLFVQQFSEASKHNKESLEFFFLLENPHDYQTIDLGSTSHGALEHTRTKFVDPKQENVLPKFLQTIAIADYVSHQKEVYFFSQL